MRESPLVGLTQINPHHYYQYHVGKLMYLKFLARESSAMSLRSMSADNGVFFVRVMRISTRSEAVGNATNKGLSSLPGRIIAGSMISGLFVAPTTYTPLRSLRPSNSVSRVFTTREEASDCN